MRLAGKVWSLVKTACGAIVGLAGILGWMNVSPEQAGQTLFGFLKIALPFVTFAGGLLFSWGIFGFAHERKIEAMQAALSECRKDADYSRKLLDDMRNRVAIYAAAHGKDVDEFIREAVEKAVAENPPKVDERKLIDQAVRKMEEKRERQENPRYRKYRNLQAEREYKAEKRRKRGW